MPVSDAAAAKLRGRTRAPTNRGREDCRPRAPVVSSDAGRRYLLSGGVSGFASFAGSAGFTASSFAAGLFFSVPATGLPSTT